MSDLFMAMLALERPARLVPDSVVAELRRQRTDVPGPIEVSSDPGGGLILTMGTSMFVVMSLDAPMPAGTLDQAIAGNMIWPDAGRVLARHRAHVIVSAFQAPNDLAGRLATAQDLTRICAAISRLTSPLGIYWVSSNTAYEANEFQATAADMEHGTLPVNIWVRYHFFRGGMGSAPASIGCATSGLIGFVGREIEFEPGILPPQIVAEKVQGTILYLLANGPVLKHGDTLGVSETEHIRIELVERGRQVAKPIYRLTFNASR